MGWKWGSISWSVILCSGYLATADKNKIFYSPVKTLRPMIRNESLTFCPGGSYEPIWCSVVTGYSQDIFHFWPHPFSQKLQRTSCKWWQFISVQRHQPGTELQPSSDLFVFKERVCERKVIGGDQLESDLERGQKIETWDNSKMRARLRQWGQ